MDWGGIVLGASPTWEYTVFSATDTADWPFGLAVTSSVSRLATSRAEETGDRFSGPDWFDGADTTNAFNEEAGTSDVDGVMRVRSGNKNVS